MPTARQFSSNIHFGPKCWEWMSGKSSRGYGRYWIPERMVYMQSHRYAYEIANGPIPDGMSVLHKCDNPACVRRDHLFLGTQKDNMSDMSKKGRQKEQKKTQCVNGHAFTSVNTYVTPAGCRQCKTCKLIRQRNNRAQ